MLLLELVGCSIIGAVKMLAMHKTALYPTALDVSFDSQDGDPSLISLPLTVQTLL